MIFIAEKALSIVAENTGSNTLVHPRANIIMIV